jgi:hypothetical protein
MENAAGAKAGWFITHSNFVDVHYSTDGGQSALCNRRYRKATLADLRTIGELADFQQPCPRCLAKLPVSAS